MTALGMLGSEDAARTLIQIAATAGSQVSRSAIFALGASESPAAAAAA